MPFAGYPDEFGIRVSYLDRALMVAVNLATAWVVQWIMGRFGRSHRERLEGAALVAFGPAFIAVSAIHGQIDAAAWLPAVIAVGVWQSRRDRSRAVICGTLIGTGIAIKTTPGLVVLALAPTARDRRALLEVVLAAAAVAALVALPFAIAAPRGMGAIFDYRGFAGRAGLTVLLQPRLALHDLTGTEVANNATTTFLLDQAALLLALVLIPVTIIVWKRRMPAASATVALLLAFYLSGPTILPQYWVWIVPFLVPADRRRAALAYQLALIPLLIAVYGFLQEPHEPNRQLSTGLVLYAYIPWLWMVTLGLLAGLIALLATPAHDAQASSSRTRSA